MERSIFTVNFYGLWVCELLKERKIWVQHITWTYYPIQLEAIKLRASPTKQSASRLQNRNPHMIKNRASHPPFPSPEESVPYTCYPNPTHSLSPHSHYQVASYHRHIRCQCLPEWYQSQPWEYHPWRDTPVHRTIDVEGPAFYLTGSRTLPPTSIICYIQAYRYNPVRWYRQTDNSQHEKSLNPWSGKLVIIYWPCYVFNHWRGWRSWVGYRWGSKSGANQDKVPEFGELEGKRA